MGTLLLHYYKVCGQKKEVYVGVAEVRAVLGILVACVNNNGLIHSCGIMVITGRAHIVILGIVVKLS